MAQQTHDTGAATTMRSARINGSTGAGFIEISPQVTPPNTPAAGISLYADGNNNPAWRIPSGFTTTIDTKSITQNRIYEFPDSSGIVVTSSNINDYIPVATGTTAGIVVGSASAGNLITSLGTNIAPGLTTNDSGYNTAVGTHALFSAIPSVSTLENTAIGAYSLYDLTTGRANTAVGESAGAGGQNAFYNTFVGYNARTSKVDCINSIILGYNATTSADNEFAIADAITQMKMVGLGSAADGAGTLLAIDSNGVIRKAGGTTNTVASIDSAIGGAAATRAYTYARSTFQRTFVQDGNGITTDIGIWSNVQNNVNGSWTGTGNLAWIPTISGRYLMTYHIFIDSPSTCTARTFEIFNNETLETLAFQSTTPGATSYIDIGAHVNLTANGPGAQLRMTTYGTGTHTIQGGLSWVNITKISDL